MTLSTGLVGTQTATASVSCPAGTVLLGGGATTTGFAALSHSRPVAGGWEARAVKIVDLETITVRPFVVCTT